MDSAQIKLGQQSSKSGKQNFHFNVIRVGFSIFKKGVIN